MCQLGVKIMDWHWDAVYLHKGEIFYAIGVSEAQTLNNEVCNPTKNLLAALKGY